MGRVRKHNTELTKIAKNLRKNMTIQERKLWYSFLRAHEVRFLRQKVVDKYIVDFYCRKAMLIVELDGGHHYLEDNLVSDKKRTEQIMKYGYKVIRFSNLDINHNFDGVCVEIEKELNERVF